MSLSTRSKALRRRFVDSEAAADLILIVLAAVLAFIWAVDLELFERFVEFSRAHENWELDEFMMIPLLFSAGFSIFAFRRWRETLSQVKLREKAERRLREMNEELEDLVGARTDDLSATLRRLESAHERYELVATGSNDGLWDWDLDANEIHYSKRWAQMLGYHPEEIQPSPESWLRLVHPADTTRLRSLLDDQCATGMPLDTEYRMLHRDGAYRWFQVRAAAADPGGRVYRIAGAQRDITDSKAIDPLTRLDNRSRFSERLTAAFESYRSNPSNVFTVMFLDLDRFKSVNDSLGHAAGDALLNTQAQRLQLSLRQSDDISPTGRGEIMARLGGDEFAVILRGVGKAEDAMKIGRFVLHRMLDPVELGGHKVYPSLSFGAAIVTPACETPDQLVQDADTALHVAKANGGGRVELFDVAMRDRVLSELEIENGLRTALSNNEFYLEYQQQYRLSDHRLTGFEALIRWRHPERSTISPAEFIPIAEKSGFMGPIGGWVLVEASTQMAEWISRSESAADLVMSVNVSTKQLEERNFAERVEFCLRETGLSPRCLCLEITESVLVAESSHAAETLPQLKAMGVGLKIDDFGSGYSSFDYLRRIDFDGIKIDRRFVQELESGIDREVVEALVALSQKLGIGVIAEGMETSEQLNALRTLGCDRGQGYLLGKPASEETAAGLATGALRPENFDDLPGKQGRFASQEVPA